jgi:hypothetical protein
VGEDGEFDGDIGSFFHYFTEGEDMLGVSSWILVFFSEADQDRSELFFKEKSYPMPSTILPVEESLMAQISTLMTMRRMSWTRRTMMMREVLIWKMRRSSHPKRRARPARVKVSITTHCPLFSVYPREDAQRCLMSRCEILGGRETSGHASHK